MAWPPVLGFDHLTVTDEGPGVAFTDPGIPGTEESATDGDVTTSDVRTPLLAAIESVYEFPGTRPEIQHELALHPALHEGPAPPPTTFADPVNVQLIESLPAYIGATPPQ